MREARKIRVGEPHRPFGVKVINFVGRSANAMGMQPIALDEDSLINRAINENTNEASIRNAIPFRLSGRRWNQFKRYSRLPG